MSSKELYDCRIVEIRFHICPTADLTGRSWPPLVFREPSGHQEAAWPSPHPWTAYHLIKPSIRKKSLLSPCVWQKSYFLFEVWNFTSSMFQKFQVSSQSCTISFINGVAFPEKKKKSSWADALLFPLCSLFSLCLIGKYKTETNALEIHLSFTWRPNSYIPLKWSVL